MAAAVAFFVELHCSVVPQEEEEAVVTFFIVTSCTAQRRRRRRRRRLDIVDRGPRKWRRCQRAGCKLMGLVTGLDSYFLFN